ncbi:MAG: hypothetical protein LBF37_00960 [Rickettsiales bacterium]|jgi:hypothetical protein|nr:hypothetical protein [Rickettsiales bacterium]
MKPTMLFAVIMITAIILAASFGLHIQPIEPLYKLSNEVAANALYVCPAANSIWDSVSQGLRPFIRYINMAFFFAVMLLIFSWGWALYQNLLKDKFEKKSFDNSWAMTKVIFWIGIIVLILVVTPNGYRKVHVAGATGTYVLCEANTPGALPVKADAVKR